MFKTETTTKKDAHQIDIIIVIHFDQRIITDIAKDTHITPLDTEICHTSALVPPECEENRSHDGKLKHAILRRMQQIETVTESQSFRLP